MFVILLQNFSSIAQQNGRTAIVLSINRALNTLIRSLNLLSCHIQVESFRK